MTPQQYQRAKSLFSEALALQPSRRAAWVEQQAADDPRVRLEVLEMLTEDEDPGAGAAQLDGGGRELLAQAISHNGEALPEQIAQYRIVGVLGRGGMGVVYEAWQDRPKRRVALKVIHANHVSPNLIKRFELEAYVLGQLQHPGIAHVYEAGMAAVNGRQQPFLAMEIIDGKHITTYSDQQGLDRRERLALLARVCDAVQHAHQKGIIHRDIKPHNILVIAPTERKRTTKSASGTGSTSAYDDVGQPKILDFGIARISSDDVHIATTQTKVGQLIGTLAYMSPEQVAGDSRDLDTRSDVYSLGVVLFQLLTEKLPLDVSGTSVAEAARIVRDEEPVHAGTLDHSLRGDVETILAKALEKEPDRRYSSAAELAADIRRYLQDEPIMARRPSALYQMQKFARRNRGLVAGILASFVILIVGVVGLSWQTARAIAARQLAEHAAYQANLAAAAAAIREQDVQTAEQHLVRCPVKSRGWEWRHLHSELDQSWHVSRVNLGADIARTAQVLYSAAEDVRFLWLTRSGLLTVRSENPGEPGHASSWKQDGVVRATLSRDGNAVLLFNESGGAQLVDAQTGTPRGAIPVSIPYNWVRFVDYDRKVSLAAVNHVLSQFRPSAPKIFLAFSPDATLMALSNRRTVSVWDLSTGQRRFDLATHPEGADGLAFSPDGTQLATAGRDRKIRLFDVTHAGALVWETPRGHTDAALTLAFSPDGGLIASGGQDRVIRVWDAGTGESCGELIGHRQTIVAVAFSTDGRRIVSADNEGLREWDLSALGNLRELRGHAFQVQALAISPDGTLLASGGRELLLWDVPTGKLVATIHLEGHHENAIVRELSFAPDGRHLATAMGRREQGGVIVVIDVQTAERSEVAQTNDGLVATVAYAPKGDQLAAVVGSDLCIWNTSSFELLARLPGLTGKIAYGPRGELLALARSKNGVRMYDTRTLRVLRDCSDVHGGGVAFSPDRQLAASSARESTEVFEVMTGRPLAMLRGHTGAVSSVAFLPAGPRLATGSNDRTIRLWNLATFEEVARLRGHVDRVNDLAFTPDGNTLFSCSGDHTIRMWDTRPLSAMLTARKDYDVISARLLPRIRELFVELGSASAVIASVDADTQLKPRERAIAAQLILQEALARHSP